MERVMGFEPTTPTLARLCSTTELHPRRIPEFKGLHLREPLADGIIQDETPCKRQMASSNRDFPGFFIRLASVPSQKLDRHIIGTIKSHQAPECRPAVPPDHQNQSQTARCHRHGWQRQATPARHHPDLSILSLSHCQVRVTGCPQLR